MDVRETLIGGKWVNTHHGVDVFDPADVRAPIARVPALSPAEVTSAYEAAYLGFRAWRGTPALDRARILHRAAALVRERAAEIAATVVAENGKSPAEARGEAEKAADFLEYYAAIGREPYGALVHDARPGTHTWWRREPLGIVLAITPWNDPLLTPARKLAPALATGNAVVLKPATETPSPSIELARALHDAGLPAGALNVVTGRTAEISGALLDDPRIAAVTFTGSNDVGERLRARIAPRNVRFQGELGGKNASVVLADADLTLAADAVVAAAYGQAGQRCTATSRVLVERSVHDEFLGLLHERVAALSLGPLVSRTQQESVLAYLSTAVGQGARLVTGGERGPGHGCHVSPAVLADVGADDDVWREEVFGPVLAVRAVDGLDQAIAEVGDTRYGLAAAIFTTGLAAAHRFADEVECGQIAVNTTTSGWDVHQPFGGFRDSGSAFKEQGAEAVHFYTRIKTVAMRTGGA